MEKTQSCDKKVTEKRVAVVGAGGVGGYLAGMLGRVCPHLTIAARGRRKEALEKNGLVLHSEYKGEITVRPARVARTTELGEQDIIFICVKNYSLEEVCREITPAVKEDTILIPVMNGVNPGERVRALLGKGKVVDALIYIVSFSNEDYSITQQGNFARLCVGVKGGAREEQVDEAAALLAAADIDVTKAEDIEVEIWRKYILNCAYNVTTAYYDNDIGQLRADKKKTEEYEALVREAEQVALAKGVAIKKEHIDAIIERFHHGYADNATSSLQRDVHAGRRSEADVFSGYIVREAKKLGISVPVSEKMYRKLRQFQ